MDRAETGMEHWIRRYEPELMALWSFYEGLSQEQRIWLWIAVVLAIVFVVGTIVFVLWWLVRTMNNILQSGSGWRPIRFFTCMWAGSGIWAGIVSFQLRQEGSPGWSVLLGVGIVLSLGFVWFLIAKLRILRGLGAIFPTSAIGCIIAPIVINLGLFVILLAAGLLAFSIWAAFQPQRVYVVNR